MAYKNNTKCGPNAVDQYDDYYRWNDGTYSRSHYVEGTGSVTGCNGTNGRIWSDDYTILSGIVELCDKCFNTASVSSIKLPSTLTTIGSNCFCNSHILYLSSILHKHTCNDIWNRVIKGLEEVPLGSSHKERY